MIHRFSELIKGIGIGIANIIPGFSGGTMAVVFGLYEKLIFAFSHFFETPTKIIKAMWAIIIGVGLGILIAVFGITLLLDSYPVPTLLLFVGLVLGSIPKIQKRARLRSQEKGPKISMLLGIALLFSLTLLPFSFQEQSEVTTIFIIGLFFIGALGSASMVIPGVSGSLIFLLFGYYDYILTFTSRFITGIVSLNFTMIGDTLMPVVIFGVGVLLGVVFIAKLIEKLMLTHKSLIYGFIVGLLIASPFVILLNMQQEYPSQVQSGSLMIWLIGLILAVLGFLGSYLLGKKEHPKALEKLHESL